MAAADAAEPQLRWVAGGAAPSIGEISIEVAGGTDLLLITRSRTDYFWCVAQVAGSPLTVKGGSNDWTQVNTLVGCNQGW